MLPGSIPMAANKSLLPSLGKLGLQNRGICALACTHRVQKPSRLNRGTQPR